MSRVYLIITDVPAAIRTCVEEEAREREMPLTHVICEALAARYAITWEAPNYKLPGTHKPGNWVLRVPPGFREALKEEADARGGSVRGVFLMAMAEHCGLPALEPRDRRRKALV